MAVAVTVVRQGAVGKSLHIATVVADADGDTQAVIPHGLGVTPLKVNLVPLHAAARVSDWILLSKDATNVTVGKTTGVGSGNAAAQLQVEVELPHSIL